MNISISNATQQATMDGDGNFSKITTCYIVELDCKEGGANAEIDVLLAVKNYVETSMQNLPLESIEIESRESGSIYRANVTYAQPSGGSGGSSNTSNDDEPTVSFDCGGGTRHVDYSLNQQHLKGELEAGGLINWNGKTGSEMDVKGVDVPTAQLRKTYTRNMRLSELTSKYERQLAALVGKVNKKKWKGWEPGEVMFLGCSYSGKKTEKISVSFNFSIQPNENSAEIADVKFSKKGFEFVWGIKKTMTTESGHPQAVITDLYVDQVVDYADFSILGV